MKKKEKIVFCWSGGKDSAFAFYEIKRSKKYEIVSLLTTVSKDYQRISMHGVREELLNEQVKQLGLPLVKVFISKASSNQEYESKMREVLLNYKKKGVWGVVFGDIFLQDLKRYRQKKLSELGLEGIFPIWMRNTKDLALSFIDLGFRAVITCIDSKYLAKKFTGRIFDKKLLSEFPLGIDPCGENGEFHSFVYDGPIFKRKIPYRKGEVVLRDKRFYYCDLLFLRDNVARHQ